MSQVIVKNEQFSNHQIQVILAKIKEAGGPRQLASLSLRRNGMLNMSIISTRLASVGLSSEEQANHFLLEKAPEGSSFLSGVDSQKGRVLVTCSPQFARLLAYSENRLLSHVLHEISEEEGSWRFATPPDHDVQTFLFGTDGMMTPIKVEGKNVVATQIIHQDEMVLVYAFTEREIVSASYLNIASGAPNWRPVAIPGSYEWSSQIPSRDLSTTPGQSFFVAKTKDGNQHLIAINHIASIGTIVPAAHVISALKSNTTIAGILYGNTRALATFESSHKELDRMSVSLIPAPRNIGHVFNKVTL